MEFDNITISQVECLILIYNLNFFFEFIYNAVIVWVKNIKKYYIFQILKKKLISFTKSVNYYYAS